MSLKLSFPILICVIIAWFFPSFHHTQCEYYSDHFRNIIVSQTDLLNQEIISLNNVAVLYRQGDGTLKQLRQQLIKTRLAFKRTEGVLEYYFPKHIKSYINGAPLHHLDPYPVKEEFNTNNYYGISPEAYSKTLPIDHLNTDHYRGAQRVVAPVGLQVLDETVFADGDVDAGEVVKLTAGLKDTYATLVEAVKKRNYFYEHEIMEAVRLELVRVFTMGVTGFDTPGSLNAMEEAAASLRGMQEVLKPLLQRLPEAERQQLELNIKTAVTYLEKNHDFDSFDRLTFLMEHINPLYDSFRKMQINLHIKSTQEISGETSSWNAYSKGIFAEDFLNPYYYTLLKESDDSEALRNLGKQLFYDTSLSNNEKMSCASCHRPEMAFSDGVAKSLASVEGKSVLRNSPSLINAVFSDRYFYDLRAVDLEEQAEHVIENHMEFNTNFPELIKKLGNNTIYRVLFEKAFGTNTEINRYRFSAALSSYVASIRSFNSSFDRYARGEVKDISAQVKLGFNLFTGKAACATCHYAPTFSGLVPPLYHENESEVLGVLAKPNTLDVDQDFGRIGNMITEDNEEIYRGSFKTMTVRNVKLTAPYFHNGAYNTLEEVIGFYNKGGAAGLGLIYEVPNQTLPADHLNLSKKEIAALIAFMESLTDNPGTTYSKQ
ncbi:cytochrome-c peroxidase [Flavobacterium suzhouense]|uniref:Cytochrome-c peroxidase n=1 Tax=Flavobacterium suzhouense TaxID=1529638 RepID=A0ABW5NV86_9FLAO